MTESTSSAKQLVSLCHIQRVKDWRWKFYMSKVTRAIECIETAGDTAVGLKTKKRLVC